MKVPYQEGTIFTIPLRPGGYGIGIVARTSPGGVMLNYFFGPASEVVPTADELGEIRPQDALLIGRVGDLSLLDETWPIIGHIRRWKREEWPMPPFAIRDEIRKRALLVQYSDTNANRVVSEEPMDYDRACDLDRDSMWGAGAAEIRLTTLLTPLASNS